jgi:hypothetical protein
MRRTGVSTKQPVLVCVNNLKHVFYSADMKYELVVEVEVCHVVI